jgi:hypothetical protein
MNGFLPLEEPKRGIGAEHGYMLTDPVVESYFDFPTDIKMKRQDMFLGSPFRHNWRQNLPRHSL